MPKPKVIETLNAFKAEVRNNEKDAMLLMAKRWNAVERGLDAQIAALTQEIDALRAIDKLPTANQLYRMERYKTLLAQTQREVGQYERFAQGEIERGQREYFALGNDAAQAMLRDLTPAGVNINFNRLPVDAVNNMIGYCKDGAPLFSVLKERALYPDAIDGLTTQLVNAMALGYNPRKTARLMKDGLAQGLTKALVIARTEQLRAFREASYQNYNKNSDIVKGWVWSSALGTRTCAACYAMHGTVHTLDERLDDHVCGRCAMIPISKGWKELGYDVPDTNPTIPSGEEEFAKLDEQQQLGVLGKGRYELYKAGKLDFGKLATFTDDKVWGRTLRVAKVGEVIKDVDEIERLILLLGDSLDIQDGNNEEVKYNIKELSKFSDVILIELKDKGVKFYFGNASVPGLDELGYLAKIHPRGWPKGATWSKVPGAYVHSNKVVAVGTGKHGSTSLTIHETIHAIDHTNIRDKELINTIVGEYEILKKNGKLTPYELQKGEAGYKEFFAESVANIAMERNMNKYSQMYIDKVITVLLRRSVH